MKKIKINLVMVMMMVLVVGTVGLTGCNNSSNNQSGNLISEEEAKNIAFKDAGVTESEVKNSTIGLDTDDGVKVYELEFYTVDKKFDYQIDAVTGDILDKDFEMEKSSTIPNGSDDNTNTNVKIDKATAVKTALAKVPDATESNMTIALQTDDGRQVYEGTIIYNNIKYDFEIDANTGEVTNWEEESALDD